MAENLLSVEANFDLANTSGGTGYLSASDALSLLDFASIQGETFHSVEVFKIIDDDGGMQLDLGYSNLDLEGENEMKSRDAREHFRKKLVSVQEDPERFLFKIWI